MQQASQDWLFDRSQRRSLSVMLFGNTHLQDLEAYRLAAGAADRPDQQEGFFPAPRTTVFSKDELLAFRDTLPYVPR